MIRDRRGVALMLVLWLIIVLGGVAVGVVAVARSQADVARAARARTVGRYAAESGIVSTMATLRDAYETGADPERTVSVFARLRERLATADVQQLGVGRYQVAIEDLSGRIDLNTADYMTLLRFFEGFFGRERATELVAGLIDWRDEDEVPTPGGGEAEAYAEVGSPFRPPNRPLQRLDEITRIRGFTDSIADVIAPHVTVHGLGLVNANTASEEVLAAVPGIGPETAARLVAQRGRSGYRSLAEVRQAISSEPSAVPPLSLIPARILIIARGWEDGSALTHEIQAVVELQTLAGETRLILRHWQERDL